MRWLQTNDGGDNRQDLGLVNESLEKAIEQLRQANEALKVTNREFCSLNHQLEIMNEAVESLSREVARLKESKTSDPSATAGITKRRVTRHLGSGRGGWTEAAHQPPVEP